ncbi:hypothetical protein [Chryseobacterium oryctis]|uniref:Lipoprotein n=1 Tax=Chryseobacterium oryctis TaxID=2952618 RepID=A0ABT3HMA5_9FLAO|nr:hypothetical protein [Chryseobacterium oryctis]MCW3160916.1 hypothetical protein [Chryseobacterium oryctis]
MKKNLVLRLLLMTAFAFMLHSCVHDEITTSVNPQSKEYHSKSLWKEDERYIENVIKVFEKYGDENYFTANFGNIYWDYAITMGTKETFLEAPVIKNGKVNFILVVEKEGDRVFFRRKDNEESKKFFNALVFNDRSRYKITATDGMANTSLTNKGCLTTEITWTWTNEDGSAGPTYTYYETHCTGPALDCQSIYESGSCGGSTGGGGTGSGGGSGGGNGGYPYPQTPVQNPCEKAKSIFNNTAVKSRYEALKGKVSDPKETGYGFTTITGPDGNPTTQTNPLNPDATNPDKMKVGIFPTTYGYSHTHLNKKDGNVSVKIFSPADINTFLVILKNAMSNGTPMDQVFGGMVASDPDSITNIYQIQYTGNGTNLPAEFTEQQLDSLKAWYTDEAQDIQTEQGELTHTDLQKLFNDTLKKMNFKDVVLFKIEGSSNVVEKINYDEYGSPTENKCL